jgi:hypothetical protein
MPHHRTKNNPKNASRLNIAMRYSLKLVLGTKTQDDDVGSYKDNGGIEERSSSHLRGLSTVL